MAISAPTSNRASIEARVLAIAKAVCLVGFPLVPMAVYLSRQHPGLGGGASFSQIANLAAQADKWTQVHFAFSVGGFLGLAAILIIRSEVAKKAPVLWTNVAAAVGVVGAAIFTGTVLMEVTVIPALARACTVSPGCLTPDNQVFTEAFADEGWRILPGLTLGGRTLMVGLAMLAVLGFAFGSLKNWEAAAIFAGAVLEIGTNTGLHQWGNFSPAFGMPGLAAVGILAGSAGIAWRLVRGRKVVIVELPDEPAPPAAEGSSGSDNADAGRVTHGPGMPPAGPGMAGPNGMDDHAGPAPHAAAAAPHAAPMEAHGHEAMKPVGKPKDTGRVEGGSGASNNDGGTIAGDDAPDSHAHGDNQGGDIH